jgi:hypothetical protein
MASATCSKELMKVLTTPSKIANALDWKKQIGGSIATIDVHANRIGLTISHHPDATSTYDESSESSESSSISSSSLSYSIPMHSKGKQKIPDSSRKQLSELVQDNKVCGFVISWPLQKDTGLMGASCGRTLFAIEELLQQPKPSSVFSVNRPICLWDGGSSSSSSSIHEQEQEQQSHQAPDIFGRSSIYARTSTKKEHCASKEQYHQDESIVATKVWEDFVKTNWPEIYAANQQHEQQSMPQSMKSSFNNNNESSSTSSQEQEQQPRRTLTMAA